jgi:hypothetical protein
VRPDILEQAGTALGSFELIMRDCYANMKDKCASGVKAFILLV